MDGPRRPTRRELLELNRYKIGVLEKKKKILFLIVF